MLVNLSHFVFGNRNSISNCHQIQHGHDLTEAITFIGMMRILFWNKLQSHAYHDISRMHRTKDNTLGYRRLTCKEALNLKWH